MRIDRNIAHSFFLVNPGMFIPYASVYTVSTSAASGLVWKWSLEHRRRNRGGKGGARPPTFQGGGAEGGFRPPPPTFGLARISRSRQDPSSFTHTIPQY